MWENLQFVYRSNISCFEISGTAGYIFKAIGVVDRDWACKCMIFPAQWPVASGKKLKSLFMKILNEPMQCVKGPKWKMVTQKTGNLTFKPSFLCLGSRR